MYNMSEKKFRQLPIIDFKYNGLEEPLSYIRTGYFHPKVGRFVVSTSKRLATQNLVSESLKQIKIKSIISRSKSKQREVAELKHETPLIFDSIKSYLLQKKNNTSNSPKFKIACKTPEISNLTDRPKSSLAVIKRLRYDRGPNFVSSVKERKQIKKSEKLHIIIKSPEIEL